MAAPRLSLIVATAGVLAGTGVWLGRAMDGIGTRPVDRDASLPGDDLHRGDAVVRTRAVTIAAPPSDVWPWLVQLGWERAGWYALDALEVPLGAARSVADDGTTSWRSLTEIAERHQSLAVGDPIPLSAELAFEVVRLEPHRHMVAVYDEPGLHMVWTLVLRDFGEATRLVARTALAGDGPVASVATRLLLDPGHAIMETTQLRGIKRRAEGYA